MVRAVGLKWVGGGLAVVLLLIAALLWHRSAPSTAALQLGTPASAQIAASGVANGPLVAPLSDVTPADREAKRFTRGDKDKDGVISREEYLANRRKAFAKLDLDHDGKLSFDEYSAKAITKFATADSDHDGKLKPVEFATTAAKRNPRTRPICPPAPADEEHDASAG